jgi:hypothetical protein
MSEKELLAHTIMLADEHADLLSNALHKVQKLMPLSPIQLSSLPLDDRAQLELMDSRFCKLYNLIRTKTFDALLYIGGIERGTFIDTLNRLEKSGFIDDANKWIEFGNLEKSIQKDYSDTHEVIVARTKETFAASQELILFWKTLKCKLQDLMKRI